MAPTWAGPGLLTLSYNVLMTALLFKIYVLQVFRTALADIILSVEKLICSSHLSMDDARVFLYLSRKLLFNLMIEIESSASDFSGNKNPFSRRGIS